MTALVVREDLSRRDAREYISKSFLQQVEYCPPKAWYSLHDPRPFMPIERVTFGSAVDAAVEIAIKALRSGQEIPLDRCRDAVVAVADRDHMAIDVELAVKAAHLFGSQVAPRYDFTWAATQHSIRTELPFIGAFDGHPDVILPGPDETEEIYDVKAAEKAKAQDAARTSYTELVLYAVARQAETGKPVNKVGYWTFVKSKVPNWQVLSTPVTDAMRRVALARAASVVRAIEADAVLNAGLAVPVNGSFPGGPKYSSTCSDCPYNPLFGGPCEIAGLEELAA